VIKEEFSLVPVLRIAMSTGITNCYESSKFGRLWFEFFLVPVLKKKQTFEP
jgi:hypothetical protein